MVLFVIFSGCFVVLLWGLTSVCACRASLDPRLCAAVGLGRHRDFNTLKPALAEQLADLAEVCAKRSRTVGILRDELYLNFSMSFYRA